MARSAFNDLCRLAERHLVGQPEWKGFDSQLRDLHLFALAGDPARFLPKAYSEDQVEFFSDHFFLPFAEVAVEDEMGVVLLNDLEDAQTGLWSNRYFITLTYAADYGMYLSRGVVRARFEQGSTLFATQTSVQWGCFVESDKADPVVWVKEEVPPVIDKIANRDVGTALQEIMLLNTPSRFIVEEVPLKQRIGGVKVPRKGDRPTYTLMTPGEVRRLFGADESATPQPESVDDKKRSGPAPHARRRHFRTLRSDRFTGKQGQVIEVNAAWVGPEERIAGGKKYRVRLDL
jgi:hypothetical protein